jgi:tripartite-type tricarboxylate transporter receptor subunit TctC
MTRKGPFSKVLSRHLALILLAWPMVALAQATYPTKPIRLIVPFPPGGSTTIMARLIGQRLTESWGQQIVVDNRGGGNTIIGSEALVKAPPDGHTILLVTSTHQGLRSRRDIGWDRDPHGRESGVAGE